MSSKPAPSSLGESSGPCLQGGRSEFANGTGEEKLFTVAMIVLVGFLAASGWHYVLAGWFKLGYPYSTFLFTSADMFGDFYHMRELASSGNMYLGEQHSIYFPLANAVFMFLARMSYPVGLAVYAAVVLAGLFAFCRVFLAGFGRIGIIASVILTFASQPVLAGMDRGNLEGLLALCLLGFLLAHERGWPVLGSFLLASAISMKAYPAVFLFLLLGERRYRETILTLVFVALLTCGSLWLHQGGFWPNLKYVLNFSGLNGNFNFEAQQSMQRGIGLFTLLKATLIEAGLLQKVNFALVNKLYVSFAALLLGLTAFFAVVLRAPAWKKALALVLAMMLLPQISASYKLVHLYLPLFMYLRDPKAEEGGKRVAWCFGLLLIPMSYWYLPSIMTDGGGADVGLDCMIKPVLMLGLMAWILVPAYRSRLARNAPGRTVPQVYSAEG